MRAAAAIVGAVKLQFKTAAIRGNRRIASLLVKLFVRESYMRLRRAQR